MSEQKHSLYENCIKDDRVHLVELSYIGEGYHGDYNENDPEDKPLLRADVYGRNEETENWDMIASTCTHYPATCSEVEKEFLALTILRVLHGETNPREVEKKLATI